jgi:imidazolonepropionase-like amidohydrolase
MHNNKNLDGGRKMSKRSILIKCGKMYDGINDELQDNMEILVEGNLIAGVGKNLHCPPDTEIIDLTEATVTPGMIDAHVHMQHYEWRKRRHEIVHNSPATKAMAFLYVAREALHRGFTTLRHAGSSTFDGYGGISAKRLIDAGFFPGSRLVMLPHYHYGVGSHGDHSQLIATNPPLSKAFADTAPTMGSGVDFFRHSVREQIKYGADYIKIMATGGFSTPNDSPDDQQLSDEEMLAIIETAHQLNKTVTAHVYGEDLMIKLAKMGIDGMEHGSMLTEETVKVMEERDVYLVPTFTPFDEIVNLNEEKLAEKPIEFAQKLRQYSKRLIEGRKIIINSKLRLGYGTDLVANHENFECGYEYEAWLKSGVDPFRALKAATSVNADIIGRKDIGSIEVGKLADISAWKRDLLKDPKALLDCAFVMKDGVVYPTKKVE